MSCDILLHWMTHLGEGSWERFKSAVVHLAGQDADSNELVVGLRFHFSDLSHADFFTGGSRKWRVLSPTLAGLAQPNAAILCGGRTPDLHNALLAAADRSGCTASTERLEERPTTLRITGDRTSLLKVAAEVGVRYSFFHAQALCADLVPLSKIFERLSDEKAPTQWSIKSFDFSSMTMVEGLLRNSACECSPRYGIARWYVHTRRGLLKALTKREAIYTAAMLQGISLLSYNASSESLQVPANVPLPESYARVACLCSGRRPLIGGDSLLFEAVPPSIAAVLFVAAGQTAPMVNSA